ncbi:MAG: toxin-antitoxin system YwqK family antitoxin [Putridiphycobacter sp.]
MKKLIFTYFFIIFGVYAYTQNNYSEYRHIQNDSFRFDFYVDIEHKKIKYIDTVYYTWYKGKKIMNTQGNSSGDVLNGSCKKYYLKGQLAESGQYKYGLKVGKWQYWDESGNLTLIENYKKGYLNGYIYYYENGLLINKEKYKSGRLIVRQEKEKKEKKEKTPKQEEKEERQNSFLKNLFKKKEKKEKPKKQQEKEKK